MSIVPENVLFHYLLPLLSLRDFVSFTQSERELWLLSKKEMRRHIFVFIDDHHNNGTSGGTAVVLVIDRIGWLAKHEMVSALYVDHEGLATLLRVCHMAGYTFPNHEFMLVRTDDIEEILTEFVPTLIRSGANILFSIYNRFHDLRPTVKHDYLHDEPRLHTHEEREHFIYTLAKKMVDNNDSYMKRIK